MPVGGRRRRCLRLYSRTMLEVDVVVLTWNDGELLDVAVTSALQSEGAIVRVFIVDNGSDFAVRPLTDACVVVRNPTNRGVASARNQGAALGAASLVCFLDSDAALLPGSLRVLADAVLADEQVALAAPVFVDQEPEESAGVAPTFTRKVARVLGVRNRYAPVSRESTASKWDVDFAIGACQVFRRSAFEQVGGLDESYFYGPEDVDFCLRLREAGWRIVQCADAPVEHPARRRNRRLLSRRGARHAWAVTRHLWRHRGFQRRVRR